MTEAKQPKLKWTVSLDDFLQRHPDLKFIDDPEKLEYYRHDLNVDLPPFIRDLLLKSVPDLVLRPTTEDQIVDIFNLARQKRIPLTVRGAGTWGYGGAVPTRGGILIDLGLMDRITVDPGTLQMTAGPGARFVDIERQLGEHGLHLLSMASGKGGTLIGWMATGGMGLGTFRYGSIRNQLVSLRVITPERKTLNLRPDDPEITNFLATEGQMGIIVEATLRVTHRPSKWFPFAVRFEKAASAYAFAGQLSHHPSIKPEDLVVYHSEFVKALKAQLNEDLPLEDGNLVIVAFDREDHAGEFKAFLDQSALSPADEKSASTLWEKRFLPMSIKHLGPSLLASEVLLPLDQVAPYHQKIEEWGKRLGVTFYPTAHLVNPEEVLFLAMVATDHRKSLFYADLVLIPMMLRLAVKQFKGRPYGLGIWNAPFLKDLYPKKELKELIRYKKKVDPAGILNPGKFFEASGKLGPFQKMLFHPDVFDLGLATTQWLMLRFFSIIPTEKLRSQVTVAPQGFEGITKDVLSCAQCGSCVARCPVYRATGDETFSAKGKLIAVKRALETKKMELSKLLPLYFCLHCGRCDEECQVNLKHRPLFEHLEKSLAEHIDFPIEQVTKFIEEVENSPEFQKFIDVVRTGFDQKILEQRNTFPKYRVQIDEEHCIHCGTCVDACMYSVRKRDEADPRKIKIHDESLCRACGACLERCPQIAIGRPATSVELHPYLLTMDDPYWNSDVVSRIDLEATTGKIPVSGTGQGDPHRGFGNDGIRFGHFHIVGPAQNLLYESTADAIAIGLGRRPKYLHFEGENLKTPAPRLITLKTPLLLDAMPMEMNEGLLSSMLEAASTVGTRVTLRLEDVEKYGPKIGAGIKDQILRLTAEEAKTLLAGKPLPRILRDHPPGLVEIEVDDRLLGRMEGVRGLFPESTLFSAVITIERGMSTLSVAPLLSSGRD